MKTKENQGYIYILTTAAILLALLLPAFCTLSISAATEVSSGEDILAENYNMCEEYSALLVEECNRYSSLDSTSDKQLSKSVLNIVNIYRKQLLDLQSHPDAERLSLAREIKLAYAKGCAAGRLGWIYHYNLPRLKSAESGARVENVYQNLCAEIDGATDSSVLLARSDGMAGEINGEIYLCLISELALPEDSLASASVIAGGLADASEVESTDLFAKALEDIYLSVGEALNLQRSRDHLSRELENIFKIILPRDDYASDKTVALFTYKLKNANSVAEMNSALQSTLFTLLGVGESRIYASLFRNQLKDNIATATTKASSEGKAAEVTPLFEDFSYLSRKADVKDEIREILLASSEVGETYLAELEEKFNADGGIVDSASKELMTLEITRAEAIKACAAAAKDAEEKLSVFLAPYDRSSFEERVINCRDERVTKLLALEGYEGFERSCLESAQSMRTSVGVILTEAKAERYLLDHKDIIQKAAELLTPADELALRRAICDYSELEPEVKDALLSQINYIVEKYNNVLAQMIRAKMSEDALYLDLCENICKEIRELARIDIAEYYNNCDRILQKSDLLCKIISSYRSLVGDSIYASFNSSEREELVKVCRDSASLLDALNPGDIAIFESELDEILNDTKLKMNRIAQSVRVRSSARDSENPEIKNILGDAVARIKASYDSSEMTSIADKAIFKINRLLTVDGISTYADQASYVIGTMKFLGSDEKALLKQEAAALKASFSSEAAIAENITVLKFIWDGFGEKLDEICASAERGDLERARDEHLQLFKKECAAISAELRTMLHLSSQKCEEYLNKVLSLETAFSSSLVSASDSAAVESVYSSSIENLNSIAITASSENLANYKMTLGEKLTLMSRVNADYSVENYNKILEIIEEARRTLATLSSIPACNSLVEDVEKRLALVSTLIDDAKSDAVSKLDALAATIRSESELYSSSALSSVEQILAEGKRLINSFSKTSDIEALSSVLTERLALLSSVKKDYITSAPNGLSFTASGTEYPLSYDFSQGYWGLIYSPSAIPSGAKLSILPNTSADLQSIARLIRQAAKKEEILFSSSLDEETLSLLRRAEVVLGVDLSLENADNLEFPVTLQLLIPSELKNENVLGVAFVTKDGKVEFYSTEQKDMLLSLKLEHFSSYYLVAEKTTDLLPFIIFLIILITLELGIFAMLVYIRYNRKRKETDGMFPILAPCFIVPASAALPSRVEPSGAVSAVILLSAAAIALGCGIALLVRAELKERKKIAARTHRSKPRATISQEEQKLLKGAQKPLLKAKVYSLDSPKEESRETDAYFESNREAERESVLCMVGGSEVSENRASGYSIELEEEYEERRDRKRHKCEVNLDVIESCFDAGDVVTLEDLKQRRIAPGKADYVKILARGALSKPLIIEAHDFSRAAEEMLRAVGGEAIRIRR